MCGLPLRGTSLNCLALEARVIYDPGLTQRTISRPTTNLWALHSDQNERPVFLRKRPTYLPWSFGLRGRLPAQSTASRLEGPGVGLYEDSYTGSLCALPLPCCTQLPGVSPKGTYLLVQQPKFWAWHQRTLPHCLGAGGQWGLCLWVQGDFNQGERSS